MEQFLSLLEQVGQWVPDDSVDRGALTLAGGALGALGWVWRRLRTRSTPERVRVNVDAPQGETVNVQIGKGGKEGV